MSGAVELRIAERQEFAGGHAFGSAGPYERLVGRAHFAAGPRARENASVVDLDKAPTDPRGRVEFVADFMILKPIDMSRSNRRMLFDYGNRGHKRALQFFNDAPATNDPQSLEDAGNGFLMRRGYVVAWLAWEGDLLPGNGRMVIDLPVATENGRPITGLARVEYIQDQPGTTTLPLSGKVAARSYPTVSLDTSRASLTRRRYPYDERIPILPAEWCFARTEGGRGGETGESERAIIPSATHIHLPAGFEPGWIYELVYTAQDPLVHGLGHVAVRDFVSFLKHADSGNPVHGVQKAYGWGRSQTGRCLRDFVYRGFNADGEGRRVFDGIMPHVAGAGRKWLNHRFAGPIVSGGQQYEDHFNPADSFPFSYALSTDHLTGRRDAILKRPETDPLVIHTQTATEYWNRRGSLVHTDSEGNDLPQPDGVRIYAWASSQHFGDPHAGAARLPACQAYSNTVATSALFRAALDAMDRWATDGTPPPPSRIPTRGDATLVTVEEWRRQFPQIPGVATPVGPNELPLMDFGEEDSGILTREPPDLPPGKNYVVLVPAVDQDGNDVAGVRAPMVAAPLGTYTGWNVRARGFGHGALYRFEGSYLPFPETASERAITGDPRAAILERYPDQAAYQLAISRAARELMMAGLMLEEDVERAGAVAASWGGPRHIVALR